MSAVYLYFLNTFSALKPHSRRIGIFSSELNFIYTNMTILKIVSFIVTSEMNANITKEYEKKTHFYLAEILLAFSAHIHCFPSV